MTEATRSLLNSFGVMFVGAICSALMAWFWFQKEQTLKERDAIAADHEKLVERVRELETKARISEAAFLPIATAFQSTLIKSLTHAHAGELDALLVKVSKDALSAVEEIRLLQLLRDRTTDMDPRISPREREDATIFPIVMKRARAEQGLLSAAEATRLVPIPIADRRDKP